MSVRDMLIAIYLDYFNNYLTIERYAEANGLRSDDANTLITLARRVSNTEHPEA